MLPYHCFIILVLPVVPEWNFLPRVGQGQGQKSKGLDAGNQMDQN